MGQVYRGRSPGGREVAVKVVHPHLLIGDSTFRTRFRNEVEAAARVGGFYTAAVVSSDPAADPPWYASAYIEGPTLHDVINRDGPLDARRACTLGAGLAEALQAIHAAGLVHRDLKPANVLMAPDGPRVIDFGIVHVADAGTALTGTGMRVGTTGYLSPEQLHGRAVTAASDVFTLGVLLVYATARHLPFPGTTDVAVAQRMGGPPDLTGVPEPLRDLLGRCLAIDPAARPVVAELLTAFGQQPVLPRVTADRRAVDGREGAAAWLRCVVAGVLVGAVLGALLVGLEETPAEAGLFVCVGFYGALGGFFCSFCFGVEWALVELRGDAAAMIFALVSGVWGVGATVVSYQRTALPWWADLLVGAAVLGLMTVVAVMALNKLDARWGRPACLATAIAQIEAGLLARLLIWKVGASVWPAAFLSLLAWAVLATALTRLLPIRRTTADLMHAASGG